ncbi:MULTISPECIES: hypothetical protein [Deferrisoma]
MAKTARRNPSDPMPLDEKLGHIWAGIFIFLVVILVVVLVGKALFFE